MRQWLRWLPVGSPWPALCRRWRGAAVTLLNVSYDPTREFYQEVNAAFARAWLARTAGRSPSTSRTAAPASRRGRSSTASRPTW